MMTDKTIFNFSGRSDGVLRVCRIKKTTNGFTLVEVLGVVVLMALTAGLVWPSLIHRTKRWRLREAAERSLYWLRWGQSEALVRGENLQLQWSSDCRQGTFYHRTTETVDQEYDDGQRASPANLLRRVSFFPRSFEGRVVCPQEPVDFKSSGRIDPLGIRLCQSHICYDVKAGGWGPVTLEETQSFRDKM